MFSTKNSRSCPLPTSFRKQTFPFLSFLICGEVGELQKAAWSRNSPAPLRARRSLGSAGSHRRSRSSICCRRAHPGAFPPSLPPGLLTCSPQGAQGIASEDPYFGSAAGRKVLGLIQLEGKARVVLPARQGPSCPAADFGVIRWLMECWR